jgi:gas vesicle protein
MGNRTDFVAGFILGGLLGTAMALLYAPRTGEETRERLLESADDLRERARERADDVVRKVRDATDDLSQRGRATLDEGATKLRDVIDRGREAFDDRTRGMRGMGQEQRPEG